MARLSTDILQQLLTHSSPLSISIYMPVHSTHAPPSIHEDQIRFKNLSSQALQTAGAMPEVSSTDIQAVSRQLEQIQGDLPFWEAQRTALAVFASPGQTAAVALPVDSDEYAAADAQFHLAPLLGLLSRLINYRLLVVSQKEPLLFEGDAYELRPAPLALPASGHSGSLQLRQKHLTHLGIRHPNAQPEYFGGAFPVVNADERLNFFRVLDRSLQIGKQDIKPLLLAGTEEDIADFRAITTYPQVLAASLPNAITEQDVQRLAQEGRDAASRGLVEPRICDLLARYEQRSSDGSGLASSDPNDIGRAAEEGRIATLILPMLATTAGTTGSDVREHTRLTFAARELMPRLNSLATAIWQAGSTTVLSTLDPHDYPVVRALFRY